MGHKASRSVLVWLWLAAGIAIDYHSQSRSEVIHVLVCLCRAVSHRSVLNVIQDGAGTVEEVTARCGAGGDCGACRPMIAKMIRETRVADSREVGKLSCPEAPAPVDAAA
jgi:bacterioferritin-associated ferredoxin